MGLRGCDFVGELGAGSFESLESWIARVCWRIWVMRFRWRRREWLGFGFGERTGGGCFRWVDGVELEGDGW